MTATAEARGSARPLLGALRRPFAAIGRAVGGGNPVLGREVRSLLRLRSVKVGVVLIPLLCTGLMLVVAIDVLFGSSPTASPSARGPLLLEVASYAGSFVLALLGAVMGAQALSSERQGRTLEPLLLTGMSPARIVAGKTVAIWTVLALVVLSCLTPMGICFLLGGVSLPQLLAAAALLLVASLVPVSFGVSLGSALRSPRAAVAFAVVVVGMLVPMSALPLLALGAIVARGGGDPSQLWWIDALTAQPPTATVVVGALVAPLYAVVAPTWLFLAAAVSALTTAGGDSSRPLRWWLVVTAPVGALVVSLLAELTGASRQETAASFLIICGILCCGAVALSGHAAARHRPPGLVSRLFGSGPTGGATLVVVVSGFSLLVAWLVHAGSSAAVSTGWVSAVIFAFVALLAGSGVALSRLVRPRAVRLLLVVVAALVVLGPLVVALVIEVVQGSGGGVGSAVAMELSPLGSILRICDEAGHRTTPEAPIFSVLWVVVGATAWLVGAVARRRPR